MNLYDQVVEYVNTAFKGKKAHFERTVFWLQKFLPNITEAQKIAAYSHDIERGVSGEKDRDYLNPDFIKMHQDEGARIMGEFLLSKSADEKTIETVKHLISKHEVGGDLEQNLLMDSDSISFFETNVENFVKNRFAEDGYEKVKGKIDWMFDRISTDEHKELARENYEKWSRELEAKK